MISIKPFLDQFLKNLHSVFGKRVYFVGLQGSYSRGEANEDSDIDIVVILDEFTHFDIQRYNSMLDQFPNRHLICGFISGRNELMHWEPSDLFQFYYDTTPIQGTLDELLPLLDEDAVNRAIKIGICNIYHGCVHNMLHQKSNEVLRELYKSASFVIQAICFRETKRYVRYREDLLTIMSPQEKIILNTFNDLKNGKNVDFSEMSESLFSWAKKWITEI